VIRAARSMRSSEPALFRRPLRPRDRRRVCGDAGRRSEPARS
jgi:hypothetical protein